MKSTLQTVRALAALTIIGTSAAQAAIIFDNFGPGDATAPGGRLVQGPDVGTIGDVDQAVKIRIGASPVFLTMVTMAVSSIQGSDGILVIGIRSDAAGSPGALLFGGVVPGMALPTVSTSPKMLLSANTDYWFSIDATDTFDGSWAFNSTGDQGITAGRTNGNPWNVRPIEDRYAIRLEGRFVNPVPEPSSMLQLGGGAIALIVLARKWRLAR
ncbi:MAG: PEP-CTERM sorting domain-containing protein [Acidobacteria bacterium]|nr:PEP-CTERM sorting domain-containing protein [Acidobacteriota bacterium]